MSETRPIDDHELRRLLGRLSDAAPRAGKPPLSMLRRARRRIAATLLSAAVALSATVAGGFAVTRALDRRSAAPTAPASNVDCSFRPVDLGALPEGQVGVVAVDGASPSDVWISGYVTGQDFEKDFETRGLFLHWDGSAMKQVPAAPGSRGTYSVDVGGPRDAWAAGLQAPQHWNGDSWSTAGKPVRRFRDPVWTQGISAATSTDVWAVGQVVASEESHDNVPFLEHYDGRTWTEHPAPAELSGANTILWSVVTIGPDDAWAVGGYGSATFEPSPPLVLHWDGRTWAAIDVPVADEAATYEGYDVAANGSDDVWFVADPVENSPDAPNLPASTIYRWDGEGWGVVRTAQISGGIPHVQSVAVGGPDDVWIAGRYYDTGSGRSLPLVQHFDGDSWTVVPTDAGRPDADFARFTAISVVGDEVWAVGVHGGGRNRRWKRGDRALRGGVSLVRFPGDRQNGLVRSPLAKFEDEHARIVLGWVRSPRELEAWASRSDLKLEPELFREWHSEPDTFPYIMEIDGEACAYGEIWEDRDEGEAELGRIIVAPDRRDRGVGRRLVRLLADEAVGRGFAEVWLRVLPWNAPAIACYKAAGFSRTTPTKEATFNRGQPHVYVWMHLDFRGP